MVLKHKRKTLGHAVIFLTVLLISPAISKDFGILTRMLFVSFSWLSRVWPSASSQTQPLPVKPAGRWDPCMTTRSTFKRRS